MTVAVSSFVNPNKLTDHGYGTSANVSCEKWSSLVSTCKPLNIIYIERENIIASAEGLLWMFAKSRRIEDPDNLNVYK